MPGQPPRLRGRAKWLGPLLTLAGALIGLVVSAACAYAYLQSPPPAASKMDREAYTVDLAVWVLVGLVVGMTAGCGVGDYLGRKMMSRSQARGSDGLPDGPIHERDPGRAQ